MQKNLALRAKALAAAMEFFNQEGFLHVETPMLVRATPEGARDYIVPSRVHPGKFYALPQSPQLYKQILMVAGVDRYYQVARCMRDEDLRADRQPEHTQLDLEMSFVTEKDIMAFVEALFKHLVKEVKGITLKEKFPVFSYTEAMEKYGCDKPDIRYGLELHNVTDIAKETEFSVFKQAINNGGMVKCINAPSISRKEIDSLIEFCQQQGAQGIAWMRVTENGLESNIAKYFNPDTQKQLVNKLKAEKDNVILFMADKESKVNEVLSLLRSELAKRLNLIKPDEFKFCWVVEFPLFTWNEEENKWEPCHHIFTMPKQEHLEYLESDPGKVMANLFDIVLNGTELGSGSIRINVPELQKRVMKVIGLSEEEAVQKFGFLINAYRYGGPPHGGMGLGFDRTVALLAGTNDIREVIAFPKNKAAQCPMDDSPNEVSIQQLREAHVKIDVVKK